jgi:glycosyltransferase involved in cell wall biosynthesis
VIKRAGGFFSELDARVNVVELPQARALTSVFGLKRYIEERRPVALVSSLTHTNVAAILANLLSQPRTRLMVVERNQFSMNRALKRGVVRLAYGTVPWLYPMADLVAAVSEGVRDDLAAETGMAAERIAVLHNPVVGDALDDLSLTPIDHPWMRDEGPPVVLSVGRFEPQKNFPLLIDAFARLHAARPVRLIILGDGEMREALEERIKALNLAHDVDLPGFDANPFRFMRRAAVYVMSSDWEGLPTAVIEAMACGAPIVATDCTGGAKEILLEGKLGRIVPKGDAGALADAMAAALDHPGDSEARIARAKHFNLDRAVDRYLEALGWS